MKFSLIIPTRRTETDYLDFISNNTKEHGKVIMLPRLDEGFAVKLNKGVQLSKGDYLVFLHDDCEVTEGWLDVLPKNGVGAFCLGENNDSFDTWGGFIDPPRYCIDPKENPDYSYWLCIHKDAMKKIGKFDERFENPMYQDVDMGLQIKKSGFKIECLPGKIIHRNGEGSGIPDERQRGYLNRKWGINL